MMRPTFVVFLFALLVAPLLLGGCRVGPGYVSPEADVPGEWRFSARDAADVVNTKWWKLMEDPVLDGLVERALAHNLDIRIAAANVEAFAARADIARAGFFPWLGYGAGSRRESTSGEVFGGSGTGQHFNAHGLALNASWELDVWGRIRSATEAARADLLASEEGRRTVVLSLVTGVATSYAVLRGLDRQLEIAKQTLESRAETVKLFEMKAEGGAVSDLEVAQVQSEYHQAAVRIPELERRIALEENALSVLLGSNPGPIPRGRTIADLAYPPIPSGLPSDLLLRRPDIRQAEQNVAAAAGDVRIARAELFPTISLTGFLGQASQSLSSLISSPAGVWGFGIDALGPIWEGGRRRGQVRVAEAVQRELVARYLKTVQVAFRETDDGLVSIDKTKRSLDAQGERVQALEEYYRFAQMRYDEGQVSYLEVLDASRRLFDAELLYADGKVAVFASYIALYKAMGGGWVCDADRQALEAHWSRQGHCSEPVPAGTPSEGPCPPCPSPTPPPCNPCPPRCASSASTPAPGPCAPAKMGDSVVISRKRVSAPAPAPVPATETAPPQTEDAPATAPEAAEAEAATESPRLAP